MFLFGLFRRCLESLVIKLLDIQSFPVQPRLDLIRIEVILGSNATQGGNSYSAWHHVYLDQAVKGSDWSRMRVALLLCIQKMILDRLSRLRVGASWFNR